MSQELDKIKKIFPFFFSELILFFPLFSLAAGLVPCGGEGEPACQICHFFVLLKNVINFLLTTIVPPLAALFIAIGGFMYMLAYLNPESFGEPSWLNTAKTIIATTLFALLIIFGAWLFVDFVYKTFTNLGNWSQVPGCE
jgi:hypothetical protein